MRWRKYGVYNAPVETKHKLMFLAIIVVVCFAVWLVVIHS
jgi:hypothetical protein